MGDIVTTTHSIKRMATTRLLMACVALSLCSSAWALEFPYNALRWMTHSAAGGGADTMVRTLAAAVSEKIGKQVVVENQLGGGGLPAASAVLKAGDDGHTWLAADNGILVFNSALYKSLPYEKTSFITLGMTARAPLVLVVSPQGGFKSAKELLDSAKANKISYASIGNGTPSQLATDLLAKRSGLQFVRVPLGNDVAALNDVMAGQVGFTVADLPSALPHLRAGKLQALGVFTPRRITALPDVPTFAELGQPDLSIYLWHSLAVHSKTPPNVQATISKAFVAATAQPSVRKRLTDAGWELLANESGFAQAYLSAEQTTWHRLIKEAGLKAD
jgi:tripartite-type tricarboxylate transporter receptor subunit TctC